MRLVLGTAVRCSDATFGELVDIVIDPTRRRVTHIVVEPHQRHWLARLVPIELAEPVEADEPELVLRCTVRQARRLEHVQHSAFVAVGAAPVEDPDWDIGVQGVLVAPYFSSEDDPGFTHDATVEVIYDRVPKGEIEIRRSSSVTSSDGHKLGRVDGFVVDADEQITHLLLERGHLWGKGEVTIPVGEVTRVEADAITLSLSRDEVGALTPVKVRRWHG